MDTHNNISTNNLSPFIRSFYTDPEPSSLDPKSLFGKGGDEDSNFSKRSIKLAPPTRRSHTPYSKDENDKPLNRSAKISRKIKGGKEKDSDTVKNVLEEILNNICIRELFEERKIQKEIKSILKKNSENLVSSKKEVRWNQNVIEPMPKKKTRNSPKEVVASEHFKSEMPINSSANDIPLEHLDPQMLKSAVFY